ncbi:MAG: acetate--CoA ligase family protein, partial [Acetobacteraceae bacterium]|nr:acetate--CoA ligase family protein [Acetobacteraceae bacterium]
PAPFAIDAAAEMVREVKGYALLRGVRGRPPCDLGALADALSRLSQFAAAHRDTLESVDINPFVALPSGGYALDALIVPVDGEVAGGRP